MLHSNAWRPTHFIACAQVYLHASSDVGPWEGQEGMTSQRLWALSQSVPHDLDLSAKLTVCNSHEDFLKLILQATCIGGSAIGGWIVDSSSMAGTIQLPGSSSHMSCQ